jgi:putative phosphoesterase
MILGVISDTHGLLRPEAIEALRGSERILHAGDIGAPEVLDSLAKIAPVTAIRGNIDTDPWARALPEIEIVEIGGVSIFMLHDLSRLDLKPQAAGFRVVVYGHSHQPKIDEIIGEKIGGEIGKRNEGIGERVKEKSEGKNPVLYFNPGSAGPRRFKLPVTVGKLVVENKAVRAELIRLE